MSFLSLSSLLSFSLMVMGIAVLTTLPSTANEVQPTPVEEVENLLPATGTLDDLSELPSKNVSDWFWNTPSETSSELYQIDSESYRPKPSVDFLEEENDWKKDNHGDDEAPSATIPLTQF